MIITLTTGSEVWGFKPIWGRWIFSEHTNAEYDFLQKRSKAVDPVFVDLQHIKEPQAEESTPVVLWLTYSPLDPRFAGLNPARSMDFFRA